MLRKAGVYTPLVNVFQFASRNGNLKTDTRDPEQEELLLQSKLYETRDASSLEAFLPMVEKQKSVLRVKVLASSFLCCGARAGHSLVGISQHLSKTVIVLIRCFGECSFISP